MTWIIIISTIIVNSLVAWANFTDTEILKSFYKFTLSPFSGIRYGYFLAHKFFLPIIAFLILGFWLFKKSRKYSFPKLKQSYLIPFSLIGLSLIIARFFSFGKWFFHKNP